MELIELCAVELANLMWEGREVMQASLIAPKAAVAQAIARLGEPNQKNTLGNGRGTLIFSDAAGARLPPSLHIMAIIA